MIRLIDDFLPDVQAVRSMALESDFTDYAGPDGETYKRVWIGEIPGVREALEQHIGVKSILGMGFRLNYAGEVPNHAIHSDMGWGKYALVLYLSEGEGGTAFWRHKEAGKKAFRPGDDLSLIESDWDDESKWEMRLMVPMKLNRAVIYQSELFHSRYPFAAFGGTPDDGRLIAVAFFD